MKIVGQTWMRAAVGHLQDESSKTEDTSQTGAREGSSLAGTSSGQVGRAGGRGNGDGADRGGRDDGGGAVLVARAGDSGDRLSNGARAVGDGEGGGLGDSVGRTTVGQGGGIRAVRGKGGHDLGGVGDIAIPGLGGTSGGDESSDGKLHLG